LEERELGLYDAREAARGLVVVADDSWWW